MPFSIKRVIKWRYLSRQAKGKGERRIDGVGAIVCRWCCLVHLVLLPGKKHTAAAAAKAKKQYTLIPAASQPRRTNGQTGRISHSIRPAGAAAAETPTASAAPSMSATNSAPSRVAPWSHASAGCYWLELWGFKDAPGRQPRGCVCCYTCTCSCWCCSRSSSIINRRFERRSTVTKFPTYQRTKFFRPTWDDYQKIF